MARRTRSVARIRSNPGDQREACNWFCSPELTQEVQPNPTSGGFIAWWLALLACRFYSFLLFNMIKFGVAAYRKAIDAEIQSVLGVKRLPR